MPESVLAASSGAARLFGPVGDGAADGQGVGMLGAEDPLGGGQQRGVLVARPGRIPRLPGEGCEVGAGVQGVRVLGAHDPLADGQQQQPSTPDRRIGAPDTFAAVTAPAGLSRMTTCTSAVPGGAGSWDWRLEVCLPVPGRRGSRFTAGSGWARGRG